MDIAPRKGVPRFEKKLKNRRSQAKKETVSGNFRKGKVQYYSCKNTGFTLFTFFKYWKYFPK